MIKIVEVKTKKQQKLFVNFQIKLYKNCKYFVPPFIKDELDLFDAKKNPNYDDCEMVSFLAYKDGKVVGRIGGILQGIYNKKTDKKHIRFTRIDFINDIEVVKALFKAVEDWGRSKGMEYIHGPLGYNDLEREGLLVEGFDQMATYEENYSYDYYPQLIEQAGYKKDADWIQYLVSTPKKLDERIVRLSNVLEKRYKIKYVKAKNVRDLINRYKDKIFDLIDEGYKELYGAVPITEKQQEQLVSQFKMIVNNDFIALVENEKEELVGFGLALPNIAKAVQKMRGRYFSIHILSLLKQIKNPEIIDTAIIAIRSDYRTKGVASLIVGKIISNVIKRDIKHIESLHQLETNIAIKNLFEPYDKVQHKRRRSYIKKL